MDQTNGAYKIICNNTTIQNGSLKCVIINAEWVLNLLFYSYQKTNFLFGFIRTRDLKGLKKVLFAIGQGSEKKKIVVLSPYFYGLQNVESQSFRPRTISFWDRQRLLKGNCYQLNNARLTTR